MKPTDDRPTTAIPGPVPGTRITEAYARLLARDAYFWAWPMANIYNKRLAFGKSPEPGLLGGVLPFPPLNRVAMLTDYVDPAERAVLAAHVEHCATCRAALDEVAGLPGLLARVPAEEAGAGAMASDAPQAGHSSGPGLRWLPTNYD